MKENKYLLKGYENIHTVCEKAIFTYGAEHQKVKAMEELGELIQAIARSIIGADHNVEEEIADVEIMLIQLRMMYQGKDIEAMKFSKLERLAGYIW